jgi:hypothetical protein
MKWEQQQQQQWGNKADIGDDDDDNDNDNSSNRILFIDRNSDRFQYILDYMRDDRQVSLPWTVSVSAFRQDLDYFGFDVNGKEISTTMVTPVEAAPVLATFIGNYHAE